jgi:hypothetical protein
MRQPHTHSGHPGPRTLRATTLALALLLVASACGDESTGPVSGPGASREAARIRLVSLAPDSVILDAISAGVGLRAQVLDIDGMPVPTATVRFTSLDSTVATVNASGDVVARRNGRTAVLARAIGGGEDTAWIEVRQRPVRVAATTNNMMMFALGMTAAAPVQVLDRLGSRVPDVKPELRSSDSTIVTLQANGALRAVGVGQADVTAAIPGDTIRVPVTVTQAVAAVLVSRDTVVFDALSMSQDVGAYAIDSLGNRIAGLVPDVEVADLNIARLRNGTVLESRANGVSEATASVGSAVARFVVVVAQVPDSVSITRSDTTRIANATVGAPLPVACDVFDRQGAPIRPAPAVAVAPGATMSGSTCSTLRIARSGFDTVRVSVGRARASLPIVVAARPVTSSLLGDPLETDSVPQGTSPWAPSMRRNSRGQLEIYSTGYVYHPEDASFRGDLHRYVSDDGIRFRYDGIAIRRDTTPCSLRDNGVENMTIVRRADGAGWRMYFAAGSFDCYGWQVFSAVSDDERNWTIEPGVRITNGSDINATQPPTGPYPAGEGMVVDRLPNGEWRMIVSTYEPVQPRQDVWQITEWRSQDQLTWRYIGPVLTTRDMPREGQSSVFSPTIREFAPGLFRMIFSGDNRRDSDGRFRIWSAVSTDQKTWQLEGELMGAPGVNLFYASLVDETLVLVRRSADQSTDGLARATVVMP